MIAARRRSNQATQVESRIKGKERSMSIQSLPVVALTLGDPAGIGPELIAKLLADPASRAQANIVLAGDPWLWEDGQKIAGVKVATTSVANFSEVRGRADASHPAFLAINTVRPDQVH